MKGKQRLSHRLKKEKTETLVNKAGKKNDYFMLRSGVGVIENYNNEVIRDEKGSFL